MVHLKEIDIHCGNCLSRASSFITKNLSGYVASSTSPIQGHILHLTAHSVVPSLHNVFDSSGGYTIQSLGDDKAIESRVEL